MIELRDELFAAPIDEWQRVPFTENHHRWLLRWYRFGDDGEFFFSFLSPRKRRYCFHVAECGRVTGAEIVVANCEMIVASYCESFDKLDKLEAVLRLTPRHIQYRLFVLLDAIKERFDEMK